MQRRIRLVVAAFAAALLVAACTSGDAAEDDDLGVRPIDEPPADDSSDDTSPDPDESDGEPEPEPEPDPFAIPDDIDEPYVDLVMNELLAVDSANLRNVLSREPGTELEDENLERIREVFSGPELIASGEDYLRYAMDADARDVFLPADELGDLSWGTQRIMEAHTTCIIAIGYYDLNDVSIAPYAEDSFTLASLAPVPVNDESVRIHNPTPWRIHDLNQLLGADDEPIPEEDWDRLNYADALQSTCEGD